MKLYSNFARYHNSIKNVCLRYECLQQDVSICMYSHDMNDYNKMSQYVCMLTIWMPTTRCLNMYACSRYECLQQVLICMHAHDMNAYNKMFQYVCILTIWMPTTRCLNRYVFSRYDCLQQDVSISMNAHDLNDYGKMLAICMYANGIYSMHMYPYIPHMYAYDNTMY